MKKVLIIGKRSYIGLSFQKWMEKQQTDWEVTCVSSRDGAWKKENYGVYDVILHVAGIAHVDAKKDMEQLYYKVNRDLAVESCKKAKEEGCRQFIFLSSLIVFGESKSLEPIRITKHTEPIPNGFYGRSKLEAEKKLFQLAEEGFLVAAVRPPMVYGRGSKGNYKRLEQFASICPVFPDFPNERSMIHIDNLCECLRLIMEKEKAGIFMPQNKEYVSTTALVCEIARQKGKKMHTTKLFNPMLRLLARKFVLINKVFGSFVYEKELSDCFDWSYCVHDFEESIQVSEMELIE